MRALTFLLLVVSLAAWLAGCGEGTPDPACSDPGMPHEEDIVVPESVFPADSADCFGPAADCTTLCEDLLRGKGRFSVTTCTPVSQSPRVVHATYRTYPFCGT